MFKVKVKKKKKQLSSVVLIIITIICFGLSALLGNIGGVNSGIVGAVLSSVGFIVLIAAVVTYIGEKYREVKERRK